MRVQFDVTHPAHVHLFRNAIRSLAGDGHTVGVTSREKELTTRLLEAYDIEHTRLSSQSDRPIGLLAEWAHREVRTARYARRFDPDVIVSRLNPPAVHAAKLVGAGSVVFHDHEQAERIARLTAPLTDRFCTPLGYNGDLGASHRRYDGYHELAYLHPNRFTPDPDVLGKYGVDPDERYFVLRFVSMRAHHDVGRNGFSKRGKRQIASALSQHGPVYVSEEDDLSPEFDATPLPIPPEHVHHLLAHASLLATDSNTMATEAGLLGTPVVRSNSFAESAQLSTFVELGEYGLVRSYNDESNALRVADELAAARDANGNFERRREELLEGKIDVTAYMLEQIAEVADE
ncbi:MAG: DUF354 domain-containing protein [Halobacteriota archaeon]